MTYRIKHKDERQKNHRADADADIYSIGTIWCLNTRYRCLNAYLCMYAQNLHYYFIENWNWGLIDYWLFYFVFFLSDQLLWGSSRCSPQWSVGREEPTKHITTDLSFDFVNQFINFYLKMVSLKNVHLHCDIMRHFLLSFGSVVVGRIGIMSK